MGEEGQGPLTCVLCKLPSSSLGAAVQLGKTHAQPLTLSERNFYVDVPSDTVSKDFEISHQVVFFMTLVVSNVVAGI